MPSNKKKLIVIPSESICEYEAKGLARLREYYNPAGFFDEVYALSPLEKEKREAYGMQIIPTSYYKLASKIREIGALVVRAYGGFWTADMACRNRVDGVPVIVSLHDPSPHMIHKSVQFADYVFCVSDAVANVAIQKGVKKDRIRLLPNRIDLNIFNKNIPREKVNAIRKNFPEGRMILHIGRLSWEKNHDTLLNAISLLPKNFFCVCIGRGEKGKYKMLCKQLGISYRIYWIDSIMNNDLPAWYAACDCFCVPSRYEGFGIVFIEAAACGAPIITSDIPPMNTIFKHGENAHLLHEYENPSQLANAITKVCMDDKYRRHLSSNAPAVAEKFDSAKIDLLEASLYAEAINSEYRKLSLLNKIMGIVAADTAYFCFKLPIYFWNFMKTIKKCFIK